MRGDPQVGLLHHISRIKSRTSLEMIGRKRRLKILLKVDHTSPGCQGFQPLRVFGKDRGWLRAAFGFGTASVGRFAGR